MKVDAARSSSVFEFTIEGPFDGPDPHTHDDHTDAFYVLEGEVEFTSTATSSRGGPGTFVAAPPGTRHGFKTREPGTARFLNIHAPGVPTRRAMRRDELRQLATRLTHPSLAARATVSDVGDSYARCVNHAPASPSR